MQYNKESIHELLDNKNIKYTKFEHDPVFTIEEMQKAGIMDHGDICKNFFLRNAKGNIHYLVTVDHNKKINLKDLAKKIESTRLSFGSDERLDKYLKLKSGSVSPFGILNDETHSVVFVIDKALEDTKLGVHPNENIETLWLDYNDLLNILEDTGNPIKIVEL